MPSILVKDMKISFDVNNQHPSKYEQELLKKQGFKRTAEGHYDKPKLIVLYDDFISPSYSDSLQFWNEISGLVEIYLVTIPPHNLTENLDILHHFFNNLVLDNFYLCGIDSTGLIATKYTETHHNQVEGLIVIQGSFLPNVKNLLSEYSDSSKGSEPLTISDIQKLDDNKLLALLTKAIHLSGRKLLENTKINLNSFRASLPLNGNQTELLETLDRISTPALIISDHSDSLELAKSDQGNKVCYTDQKTKDPAFHNMSNETKNVLLEYMVTKTKN